MGVRVRLHLVRHGQAAARFDADRDPGLDDTGRRQAEAMADVLLPRRPLPVLVSPLRRTLETAAALERRWGTPAMVEPLIAEIPSPISDLAARGLWLREIAQRRWPDLDPVLRRWRHCLLAAIGYIRRDTVLVTHFIPINVVIGHVRGDDRVVCFQPDNCSCTELELEDGRLTITALGREATTRIL
ncbi:MAG TPA: histidine phosphatase family protein [Alphaproteobacteria bacterium]|nr:histidine phosphatase family protein [Alphaproteobacteria bacterium]